MLDVRKDPAHLAVVFPGYPAKMSADRNLWSNYFSREFETKVSASTLNLQGADGEISGAVVHESWTGCLDVLRHYGTDILIIGASDTAQGVPPDEMARHFPGRRILMCASPSLTVHGMQSFLKLVSELPLVQKQGIHWVIFGLSSTILYLPSLYYPAVNHGKSELLAAYRKRSFLGDYGYLNRRLTIPWSWNEFLPARKDVQHVPLPSRFDRQKQSQNNPERWSIFPFTVTPEELKSPQRIAALRAEYKPMPYFFSGNQDPDCSRMTDLRKILTDLRDRAQSFAGNTLFFLNPTLGDELNAAPDCYLPSIKEAMSRLKSGRTRVLDQSAADYGLEISDYAIVERPWRPNEIKIDMAHVNIAGARKVTAALADKMRESP